MGYTDYINDKNSLIYKIKSNSKQECYGYSNSNLVESAIDFSKLRAIVVNESFQAHHYRPMRTHEYAILLSPILEIECYRDIERGGTLPNWCVEQIILDSLEEEEFISLIRKIDFYKWVDPPKTYKYCSNPMVTRIHLYDEDGNVFTARYVDDGETFDYSGLQWLEQAVRLIDKKSKAYLSESESAEDDCSHSGSIKDTISNQQNNIYWGYSNYSNK